MARVLQVGGLCPVRVLVAVKGQESESYFQHAALLASVSGATEVLLVHVLDEAAAAGLDRSRRRAWGQRHIDPRDEQEIAEAEAEFGRSVLSFARGVLAMAGVPDTQMNEVITRGKPRDTLREIAGKRGVGLVIVGARRGETGPHSLGKTARFLVDHSPCAVLVVR